MFFFSAKLDEFIYKQTQLLDDCPPEDPDIDANMPNGRKPILYSLSLYMKQVSLIKSE